MSAYVSRRLPIPRELPAIVMCVCMYVVCSCVDIMYGYRYIQIHITILPPRRLPLPATRQHTSACVSIRQHTSAYASHYRAI
jgi:hypothetical protein